MRLAFGAPPPRQDRSLAAGVCPFGHGFISRPGSGGVIDRLSEELGAVRVSKGVGTAISGYDKGALADGVTGVGGTPRRSETALAGRLGSGLECGQRREGRAGSTGRPHTVLRPRRGRETTGVTRVGGKSGGPGQHRQPGRTWSGDGRVSVEFGEGPPSKSSGPGGRFRKR